MKRTLKEKVDNYINIIVRNELATINKVNPADITDQEVKRCVELGEVGEYKIMISDPFLSTINNIEYQNVNCALLSKETGYWYSSGVLEVEVSK